MTAARAAALVLAAVLVVAAGAKLARRGETGRELASLGLVAPGVLAWTVPAAELTVAGLLVVAPAWGGMAAFALLVAFTTVLVRVLRSGRAVSCNCFGSLSSRPISPTALLRNLALVALAVIAATA
ncbi:MAG: hypothetical protein OEY70_10835 [Acidimicrobiia bacterium]|nr:hypothetical protein [Acidimicrobiia bacterium]